MICQTCGFKSVPEDACYCPECGLQMQNLSDLMTEDGQYVRSEAHFADFQIRAWMSDDYHAKVLVHSSPAGDMRRPLTVSVDMESLSSSRQTLEKLWLGGAGSYRSSIKIGHELSMVLLPPQVLSLLDRSLEHIDPGNGLRLRLCLEKVLIDLPWELLYRQNSVGSGSLGGFLALDPRISLVREAPVSSRIPEITSARQRLVYVGALGPKERDGWLVKDEHKELIRAVKPVKGFLYLEDNFQPASGNTIHKLLSHPAAIFHYAGHVQVFENNRSALVREIHSDQYDWLYSEELAGLLWKAGVRVAFFNACNSGDWTFVKPLLQIGGLSALIGVQGMVANTAAFAFSRKLYSYLAVGLSFDEAVTAARLHLLEPGVAPGPESCAWATYIVYMPSSQATLFPRPNDRVVREHQQLARSERIQIVNNVTTVIQNIGTVDSGGKVTGVNGH